MSLVERFREPWDASALVAFRVLFGLLITVSAIRFMASGWVEPFFVKPSFFFKYWGFSWVEVWPSWALYLQLGLVALLGLMVAAGLFYRVSAALLFVTFTYLELLDVTTYLNHYYLVSLLCLLLAVMPLNRMASLDARRRPEIASRTLPAWCTYLLRFQVAVVYFYAGLAKLNADWLLHGQPLGIWLSSRADLPLVGPLMDEPALALAMSWGGFVYDTTIWLWLSWRRTRPYAYLLVLVFHTAVGVLFKIGMFPFIMTTAALVFFSPSWPRKLWARLRGVELERQTAGRPGELAPIGRLGFALAGAFVLFQVLMPLRHYAYPGNVLWNEQGMRWSWKVMVREKNGAVTYHVTLPDGRRQIVEPRRYLTAVQEREMSGQPDLILKLGHHIAEDYRRRGMGEVEVRVRAHVSLNGRRSQLLIDPRVDLTEVSDDLRPAAWILPEPSEPPLRLATIGE